MYFLAPPPPSMIYAYPPPLAISTLILTITIIGDLFIKLVKKGLRYHLTIPKNQNCLTGACPQTTLTLVVCRRTILHVHVRVPSCDCHSSHWCLCPPLNKFLNETLTVQCTCAECTGVDMYMMYMCIHCEISGFPLPK